MINDAREEIKKCQEIGHKGEEVDRLKNLLKPGYFKANVVSAVEQFYENITNRVISDAALGWFFACSFDKHFMGIKALSKTSKKEKYSYKNQRILSKNDRDLLQLNSTQTLIKLNSEKSILKKYDYLKKLVNTGDLNIINDSFKEEPKTDLGCAIKNTFDNETVNLLIIGGGVCGLFWQ